MSDTLTNKGIDLTGKTMNALANCVEALELVNGVITDELTYRQTQLRESARVMREEARVCEGDDHVWVMEGSWRVRDALPEGQPCKCGEMEAHYIKSSEKKFDPQKVKEEEK